MTDWTPFLEAVAKDEEHARLYAKYGMRIALNNLYQVVISQPFNSEWGRFVHLSIKRIDKLPIPDWADLQRIKNELVGNEFEAMEIYPAERRLVDEANQYHLWVKLDGPIPVGFSKRSLSGSAEAEAVGAKQRLKYPRE